MNDRKALWVWVGVAVVVIVAVWGALSWFARRAQAPAQQLLGVPVQAPKGQVVSGFPEKFLLSFVSADANAAAASSSAADQVANSYSIKYSSSTNQYTAEWISSSTILALYNEYHDYVLRNGWTIANHADFPTLKGIYATNASSSAVNIVITTDSVTKGSKITITYVDGVTR